MKSARYFEKKNRFPSTIYFALFILSGLMASCGGGGSSGEANPPPPVAGPGSAIVSWDKVGFNTDSTPCTDLAGYRVYYGNTSPVTKASTSVAVPVADLADPDHPAIEIGNLASGATYYFRLSAYDTSNPANESPISLEEVSKSFP
jgi:hypothetical protein